MGKGCSSSSCGGGLGIREGGGGGLVVVVVVVVWCGGSWELYRSLLVGRVSWVGLTGSSILLHRC